MEGHKPWQCLSTITGNKNLRSGIVVLFHREVFLLWFEQPYFMSLFPPSGRNFEKAFTNKQAYCQHMFLTKEEEVMVTLKVISLLA
jgi:hypothetical protein